MRHFNISKSLVESDAHSLTENNTADLPTANGELDVCSDDGAGVEEITKDKLELNCCTVIGQ